MKMRRIWLVATDCRSVSLKRRRVFESLHLHNPRRGEAELVNPATPLLSMRTEDSEKADFCNGLFCVS